MNRSRPRLEEFFQLLPSSVEETDELLLRISARAVPDPAKAWSGSQEYATVDKRVVLWEDVDAAINEVRDRTLSRIDGVLARYRAVLAAYRTGNDEGAAEELVALAEEEARDGHHKRARHIFQRALSFSLPLNRKVAQIKALRGIARVARAEGNLLEARLYYLRSTELAAAAGEIEAEITGWIGIGNVYALQGGWDEAEDAYCSALDLADRVERGCDLQRGQIYTNLAAVATRKGRYEEADRLFDDALAALETAGADADLIACHHAIAVLRKREGRQEDARLHFEKALDYEPNLSLRSLIESDLATFCLESGNSVSATDWARKAEEHAIASSSPYALCHMYRVLGTIARHRGAPDGMTFFEKSLEIAREKGYPLHEAEVLLEYAYLRHQTGNAEEARSFLDRAESIFSELGAESEVARVSEVRDELFPEAVPAPAAS